MCAIPMYSLACTLQRRKLGMHSIKQMFSLPKASFQMLALINITNPASIPQLQAYPGADIPLAGLPERGVHQHCAHVQAEAQVLHG